MNKQLSFFPEVPNPSDVVYTPHEISKQIIKILNPQGKCLDPCRGNGAFYNYLPSPKDYCELSEGKDFFDYNEPVNWIITNPPYSNFKEFLEHAFILAENVSFLIPLNKPFSEGALKTIHRYNMGIMSCLVYGSGSNIGFEWGFPVANFHFKKGYSGDCRMILGLHAINAA